MFNNNNTDTSPLEKELTAEDLKSIRLLIFGDETKDFPPSWSKQGFCFKSFPPYSLEQIDSGPCGVIAAVEAQVIDELIYGSKRIILKDGLLRPTFRERNRALSKALTEVICRARSGGCEAVVAIKVTSEESNTQKIKLLIFSNDDMLYEHINSNIGLFKTKGGISLFMYSLVLTRGIEKIKSDMDFPDRLIGEDSYASQEIVNLILTGQSVTNVFNGNKEIGGTNSETILLKGIDKRSRIGLLTLAEYEHNDEVGSFLKHPENPIWVLNGNRHYLVLFGTSRDILEDTDKEFHLFYSDSLFSHPEIKLEINPKGGPTQKINDLPATIRCVLTRWKTATINVKVIEK